MCNKRNYYYYYRRTNNTHNTAIQVHKQVIKEIKS